MAGLALSRSCVITLAQWGGWSRNDINSAEDLKGLKLRTTGLASEMAAKMDMAAEAMSGPAMFQALQTGASDAGEFIGPWTDSALGYYQVAKNYYWPGIGEPSSTEEGVQVKTFPEDVITAMGKSAAEVIDELRQDDDELVKRIAESFVACRDSVGSYMIYADNGQMNVRAAIVGY